MTTPAGLIVVSYGGGTNSCAMLVGLHERGERPDHILFADTGGEKPHTYDHLLTMQDWCASVGFPPIVTVKGTNPSDHGTLEAFCWAHDSIPSIAFGFKSCSQRTKGGPLDKYTKAIGGEFTKLIGIDADESHRQRDFPNTRYPLIEWNWGRDECVAAIARAGIQQPGKSACFFCPSSSRRQIFELRDKYPDLLQRALAMEANFLEKKPGAVKGLGRRFAWRDLLAFDAAQINLLPDSPIEIACDCYDGDEP